MSKREKFQGERKGKRSIRSYVRGLRKTSLPQGEMTQEGRYRPPRHKPRTLEGPLFWMKQGKLDTSSYVEEGCQDRRRSKNSKGIASRSDIAEVLSQIEVERSGGLNLRGGKAETEGSCYPRRQERQNKHLQEPTERKKEPMPDRKDRERR